jgi:hypothetical protein
VVAELLHADLVVCHLHSRAMLFDGWIPSLWQSLLPPPFRVDDKEPSNHVTASPEVWDGLYGLHIQTISCLRMYIVSSKRQLKND